VTSDYRVLANRPQVRRNCAGGDFRKGKIGVCLKTIVRVYERSELAICKEACHMAIESHLAELEKRHQALEQEIAEALTHPSADDLQIAELKRKKLHVKDEIARLRQDTLVH
jgi:hypothetical protein